MRVTSGRLFSTIVSLDVLPADVSAEHAPAMVAACTSALAEGECALASELPESARPQAVAIVLWQGDDFLRVTVRVGRGGRQWVARALTFSDADSVRERWTAVGLTVATLVEESQTNSETRSPSDASSTPPAPPAPVPHVDAPPKPGPLNPSTAQKPAVSRWLVSAGGLAGPGWDAGGWEWGGWLAGTFRFTRVPVQVHAAGSWAASSGPRVQEKNLTSRWLSAGFGAGLYGSWPSLALTGSAELELAYRRVDVTFNGRGASDEELPLRLRSLVSVAVTGPVAVTAGGLLRLPPQSATQRRELVVASPALSGEALVGIEVRL